MYRCTVLCCILLRRKYVNKIIFHVGLWAGQKRFVNYLRSHRSYMYFITILRYITFNIRSERYAGKNVRIIFLCRIICAQKHSKQKFLCTFISDGNYHEWATRRKQRGKLKGTRLLVLPGLFHFTATIVYCILHVCPFISIFYNLNGFID